MLPVFLQLFKQVSTAGKPHHSGAQPADHTFVLLLDCVALHGNNQLQSTIVIHPEQGKQCCWLPLWIHLLFSVVVVAVTTWIEKEPVDMFNRSFPHILAACSLVAIRRYCSVYKAQ